MVTIASQKTACVSSQTLKNERKESKDLWFPAKYTDTLGEQVNIHCFIPPPFALAVSVQLLKKLC